MGWENTRDCIEPCFPEQLKIEKRERKTQAQPHSRHRFAGTEVGAADSAERGGT